MRIDKADSLYWLNLSWWQLMIGHKARPTRSQCLSQAAELVWNDDPSQLEDCCRWNIFGWIQYIYNDMVAERIDWFQWSCDEESVGWVQSDSGTQLMLDTSSIRVLFATLHIATIPEPLCTCVRAVVNLY